MEVHVAAIEVSAVEVCRSQNLGLRIDIFYQKRVAFFKTIPRHPI